MINFWADITGHEQGRTYPTQQTKRLGRVEDTQVIYPYGLYCDAPPGTKAKHLCRDSVVTMAVIRPDDINPGEPVYYHPETNTRVIVRNNGDLDILTGGGGGNVNIVTDNANITASQSVNVETVEATITASSSATIDSPETTATGNLTVNGNVQVGGDFNNDGKATLGGGGKKIAVDGDPVVMGKVVASSGDEAS